MSGQANGAIVSPSLTEDEKQTMANLAASWAGLIRSGKDVAADEVEKIGKAVFGDDKFKQAMADQVGGQS